MHDGAPAHYTLDVRHYLDDTYGNRWIGRGGPVQWPARSPDLNPIDYYVWGHLKSLVYAQPIPDIETLRQRIIDSCNTIRNQPGIFERVRGSMQRRMHSCINSNGGHIEHLLWLSFAFLLKFPVCSCFIIYSDDDLWVFIRTMIILCLYIRDIPFDRYNLYT